MEEGKIPDFWCPKCDKLAARHRPMTTSIGFARSEYVYFVCNDCGLIYLAKEVNKDLLREYLLSHQGHYDSFRRYWRIINAELEKSKKYYLDHGWKVAVFKRKAPLEK